MLKKTKITLNGFRNRLRSFFFFWHEENRPVSSEPALRQELFSSEQMEAHGQWLSEKHKLGKDRRPDRLLKRLAENEHVLSECFRHFSEVSSASKSTLQIGPAGEWLLDNYWLVEEQIYSIKKNMPRRYMEELPQLAAGPAQGLPRVYDIVLEHISHNDGRLDIGVLNRFIKAYQAGSVLTLGELWAIPLVLRLALIENLRRVSTRVMSTWQDQSLAIKWADRMIEAMGKEGGSVVLVVAEMAASNPPMSSAFVAELARCTQGQNAASVLPLTWLEELLSPFGLSVDKLIHQDTQQQAADQVSISNTLNSLRIISAQNWRDFVEDVSLVEQTLRMDPAGIYAGMDFATRDHYRHVVEKTARKYQLEELEVARKVVALARDNLLSGDPRPEEIACRSEDVSVLSHVGYYLIDDGRPLLRPLLVEDGGKPPRSSREGMFSLKDARSLFLYLGLTLALTALFAWPFFKILKENSWHHFWLALALIPVAVMASQLGIKLVNWLTTSLISPDFMPRMDYAKGIPPEMRTLVVMPTMLGCEGDIEKLADRMEVHFLANRDKNIQFGLLTDFKDAPSESMPGDQSLLYKAHQAIEHLNSKYPSSTVDYFFLCHRPRVYNPKEGVWMGRERKRGKLSEFNALLLGHEGPENFMLIHGNTLNPPKQLRGNRDVFPVHYVITLDTDTQLPRDAAWQMIGTMAHPLNRPINDAETGRVIAGYAVMQPRVGTTLVSAMKTKYAALLSNDPGIDPYTNAVSDIYQDLFSQGSYVGKGIYDLAAFENAVKDRFPDNSILSHDLIEGCFARSGLITDLVLFEDSPSSYASDAARRHRWIRGDWQLLPWLMPLIPALEGKRGRNPLSILSLWKMGDNLRRSLVAPSLLAMFLTGWFATGQPVLWTAALLGLIFALPFLDFIISLFRKPTDISISKHLESALGHFGEQCLRTLLTLVWLSHEAAYTLDAIFRTLWRLLISRKNLLQWNPSSDTEKTSPKTLRENIWAMRGGVLIGAGAAAGACLHPQALFPAMLFAFFWLASPFVAWHLSRPRKKKEFIPTVKEKRFLRHTSRRIWAFFDRHVNEENNWLPPDNVQEQPGTVVAHRTSPTNIGLSMLAHLCAHDFRYLSTKRLLDRLDNTVVTMFRMERYQKHFYNWYDTRTLEPLIPQYISTVDSGNMAGHLLTLRQGLLTIPDEPVYDRHYLSGILDTMQILAEPLGREAKISKNWQTLKMALAAAQAKEAASLDEAGKNLWNIYALAKELEADTELKYSPEGSFWMNMLVEQCRDLCEFIEDIRLPQGVFPDVEELQIPTLRKLAELDMDKVPGVAREAVYKIREQAGSMVERSEKLAASLLEFATMDFGFLFDKERDLFSIGYNVQESRLDKSYYDLLASEARLAYYVAISQNQIPQESWFQLGRMMNTRDGSSVLMSWSGSMFEYLMPELVMPSLEGTILNETCHNAVHRQIAYGLSQGLPWGISESAYNMRDAAFNYQYQAFGAPGLGLKRGLANDYVVAPYASALALMFVPDEACKNMKDLAARGACGRYGLYEAVDYTTIRLPRGQSNAVIYCFMAHHQAMSLLALATVLLDGPMQKRFMKDPHFKASSLLLEERMPRLAPDHLQTLNHLTSHRAKAPALKTENRLRVFGNPDEHEPAVQLLSNSNYHVMVNSSGAGYSRYQKMAVTRWRLDPVADGQGLFCYLRDLQTGEYWSSTHQPALAGVDSYEAVFSAARAEFKVKRNNFDVHTEIVVSPEEDVELRRVNIVNRSHVRRSIEVTSYAEVVLSDPMADAQHPAFNKLFVQSEIVPEAQTIICSRRPRSRHEGSPHMFHLMSTHGCSVSGISYETDRSRFVGRGRTLRNPAAMEEYGPLSGAQGAVLDPVVAIRCYIALNPGEACTLDLVVGVGLEREGCMRLAEKFRDRHLADRVFDLVWTHSQVQLHQFNASIKEANLYEHMAASIIYPNQASRAERSVLEANELDQSRLWSQSISGDLPIVLVRVSDTASIELVAQMVKAHAYWRLKGLAVDLVIWNEDDFSYRQNLHDMIMNLIPSSSDVNIMDQPGGIFVRAGQLLSREDKILIQAVACLSVSDSGGSLAEQIYRRKANTNLPPSLPARRAPSRSSARQQGVERPKNLLFPTSHGGFSPDGWEYIIYLKRHEETPAPWINVLANENFGCIVSERGSSYTWQENAHEFRLTPWSNDPVTDSSGEAVYIRDEESGKFWSPTPGPARSALPYLIRHGFGYSVFEHLSEGIESRLWVYVAKEAPVKFYRLKLANKSERRRTLSATGYVEWVLGDLRSKHAMHISTGPERSKGAIFAKNAYAIDFPGKIAFFDVNLPDRTITGDRLEFIGRNGSTAKPEAMGRTSLSGRTGPGFDPCGAIHTVVELAPGEERELVFVLGAANNAEEAQGLLSQYSDLSAAQKEFDSVKAYWAEILQRIQINTPNQGANLLANGWLMYQTIASRFFARSGFYQSGGAFGFRDQLQDSMAMIFAEPGLVRKHLLRSAAHQFPEGDAMHWWHPPADRGVRTRCSDDFLWLPSAVERYVRITGDFEVLDEPVRYVEGRPLNPGEESYYDLPLTSTLEETLYEHCVRAIRHSFTRGRHGLPLIGAGDWNDGMNMVGIEGKGESVWLGLFGYHTLRRFAHLAARHCDPDFSERCLKEAESLRNSLEEHAWDGAWYRRAYFDDGTALGSAQNPECSIDSITQSWAVLSGAVAEWRQEKAMQSLEEHLVRRDIGIIQLLNPPFDKSDLEPGYIKGYVPGVRENGGQYTHSAIWAVMAFAALGQRSKAWELLDMINPLNHTRDEEGLDTYKVEPYVLSADVYSMQPHAGRGGWSWLTGAAAWMYRLIIESLAGLRQEGNRLSFQPVLPEDWPEITVAYKYRRTLYNIRIIQQKGDGNIEPESLSPSQKRLLVDGEPQPGLQVLLKDDGAAHEVEFYIRLSSETEPPPGLE